MGFGEYSIAVENKRVKESVVAFGYRGVEHEVDRIVFTDWTIILRNRELHQFHMTAAPQHRTANNYGLIKNSC